VQSVNPVAHHQFKDVIRIYAKKEQVHQFNHERLRDLKRPVLAIHAIHEGRDTKDTKTEEACNLHAVLPISIGCRIMLVENIWVEQGLVNGAFGTVCDIIWSPHVDNPRLQAPLALLIHFDNFTGLSAVYFSLFLWLCSLYFLIYVLGWDFC
jgi:ATP-dependent DNA helicase PIF1